MWSKSRETRPDHPKSPDGGEMISKTSDPKPAVTYKRKKTSGGKPCRHAPRDQGTRRTIRISDKEPLTGKPWGNIHGFQLSDHFPIKLEMRYDDQCWAL
jgi:hypothetical protein